MISQKKRIILTEPKVLFETRAPGGEATGFTKVSGSSINGIKGINLTHGLSTNIGFTDLTPLKEALKFDEVNLLLENQEVIILKGNSPSEFSISKPLYYSYETFSVTNEKTWDALKSTAIKKIRLLLNGKEMMTQEVSKKYSNAVKKAINCIDELNAPKVE